MREHGMIFQDWEVRAILAGLKRQTRRVVTRANCTVDGSRWTEEQWRRLDFTQATVRTTATIFEALKRLGQIPEAPYDLHLRVPWPEEETFNRVRPVIDPGDRIWVRETWQLVFPTRRGGLTTDGSKAAGPGRVVFASDQPDEPPRWRSPIHLCRADSRLVLDVAEVRIQRLWEIDESDAQAEGVECIDSPDYDPDDHCDDPEQSYRAGFSDQWVKINGQKSWDANPWILAYTFMPVADKRRKAVRA